MANKYIIHGATYNGDGTSSAEATSNGGVGAWNTINYFAGTAPAYGVLAGGDTVNVRTLSSSGGAVSISSASDVTLGSASATDLSPILWNFDNGIIWPGVSGQVTVTTTTQVPIILRSFNNIEANNNRLSLISGYAYFGNAAAYILNICNTSGLLIDMSAHNLSHGGTIYCASGTHVNPYIKKRNSYLGLIRNGGDNTDAIVVVNPKIELLGATNAPNIGALFVTNGNYQGSLTVFGGECFGAGCVDLQAVASSQQNASAISLYGFKYPRNMPLCSVSGNNTYVVSTSGDGAVGGSYFDSYFTSDSRSDGYYPTLNAMLETSGHGGWSYKVYPYAVTKQKPARISVSKLFTQAAATKTITLHFLWPQGMPTPTKDDVYIVVGYTNDATGNKDFLSTKLPSPEVIAEATAAWSTVTYGPVLFSKRSLSITTPGNIKQDTEISVSLFVAKRSSSANDILFVDPDFTLG